MLHPLFTVLSLLAAPLIAGPKLPAGFIEKRIGQGVADPVALAFASDGTGFLAERDGRIHRIKGDTLLPQPAATLAVDTAGDRGLLGLALDAGFPGTPRLYAAFASQQPTGNQIRLVSYPVEGDRIDPAKETLILVVANPGNALTALGGAVASGADGKLYFGVGDLNQPELAQDLNAVNGKLLRLNPNGFIPNDNPYYATGVGQGKAVWAAGLGDPSGLVFHAAGALYVADAKAGGWQEINVAVAGGNYGWPTVSGPSTDARFKPPFHAYPNSEGCRTQGGDFHVAGRGRFPADFAGDFFLADPCGNWIRRLIGVGGVSGERKDFVEGAPAPATLRFGPQGDLYYATKGLGGLYKLSYAPELSISILAHPEDVAVQEGESITFRVTVQGPPPLRYQWKKNGEEIPGATASSLTLASATLQENGARFSVAVANDHGSVESRAALVTVGRNNIAPRIVTQPPDVGVKLGQGAVFAVVADGTSPLRYQWNRKGVPIPGATGSAYSLPTTTLADNGVDFFVEISNAGGLVTSRRAILSVLSNGVNAAADLHYSTVANGRGPVEPDMSNGESDPDDGDMISIGDRLFARGLGVYANSEVAFNLSAGCDSFYAEIGVDGERGATGTVLFEVTADGMSLYRGSVMTNASPAVKLALPLTGKKELRLKVTDAGDQSGNDYANWADARLKCWDSFTSVRESPGGRAPRTARSGWYRLGLPPGAATTGPFKVYDLKGRLLLEYMGAAAGLYPVDFKPTEK